MLTGGTVEDSNPSHLQTRRDVPTELDMYFHHSCLPDPDCLVLELVSIDLKSKL